VDGILFGGPLSIPGACVGQGELNTPAGRDCLGVEPFLGCLVVDPEAHVRRQDPEESLRGRASIAVSCEDGGASREVAAVDCFVTGEVQSVGQVRAQRIPHIQDDCTESVGETVFGVRKVQILDVSGVQVSRRSQASHI